MMLYHGTTYCRFKDICIGEKIDITTENNTHFPKDSTYKTKYGYVYLTDNSFAALDFASRCWTDDKRDKNARLLTVIEVDVPDELLEIDEDEQYNNSTTVTTANFYKVKTDIRKDLFKRIAYYQFSSFDACCKYIDNRRKHSVNWSTIDNPIWVGDINLMNMCSG